MTHAGFAQRYAAWSLDATAIAALASVLAWPLLAPALAAWVASGARLVSDTSGALFAGMMAGESLPVIATGLLRDPRLIDGADAMQRATWQVACPLLAGYALLALPWHVAGVASRWQGSPGKRVFGLFVTGPDASRPTVARALARHLAATLSWLTLNIGHLVALGPAHAALHDRLAGTRVYRRMGTSTGAGAVAAWIALQAVAALVLLWWLLGAVRVLAAGQP